MFSHVLIAVQFSVIIFLVSCAGYIICYKSYSSNTSLPSAQCRQTAWICSAILSTLLQLMMFCFDPLLRAYLPQLSRRPDQYKRSFYQRPLMARK